MRAELFQFTWKPNALRHSYASYRLADIEDVARVALEMGYSPAMLFRNYRELVTEQQTIAWFGVPPEPGKRAKNRSEESAQRAA